MNNNIQQHAIFADLAQFSLTLGCSKYELRFWNQCNMWRFCEILAKKHLIINQIPTTIFINMICEISSSMELKKNPWNFKKVPWNAMEFHGTFGGKWKVQGIPWNPGVWKKLQGIPWYFWFGQNSMEFHEITWNLRFCCLSSMEFHRTTGVVHETVACIYSSVRNVDGGYVKSTFKLSHGRIITSVSCL